MNEDTPRPVEELLKEEYGFKAVEDKSTSRSIYTTDSSTNGPAINLLSYKDLKNKVFPEARWVVEGLVPSNGITCISGEPKTGKSFITLDLIISIATGAKFLGQFNTEQKNVLLISKEDGEMLLQDRCKLLDSEADRPIFFCTDQSLFLDNDTYTKLLIDKIEEEKIGVVVIDSFRRILKGDENSSQVVSEVHNRLKVILEHGVSIIFIHHHGKEGLIKRRFAQKLRGSSDILAMLDSLLIAERKDVETLKITQEVVRVAKPTNPFIIRFPTFEGEDTKFEFKGFIEEEKEKKEEAKEAVLNFLDTDSRSDQKTIIESIRSEDKNLSATTIKETLKFLTDSKEITSWKEGRSRFYSLTEQAGEQGTIEEII